MTHKDDEGAALTSALRALAEIEAGVETPSRIDAAVMAHWDSSHSRKAKTGPSRKTALIRGAATMAAGVTILAAVAMEREWRDVEPPLPASPVQRPSMPPITAAEPTNVAPPSRAASGRAKPVDAPAVERTRLVLIGAPLAANEPIRIVRMRVASSALGALGFDDVTSADVVDVDVLVGEDGVARGVRMSM